MEKLEAKYKALAKPEYAALANLIIEKKVKRRKDLNGLSMPPPLGMKPKDCTTEVAVEFVKEFIPVLWKMIAAAGTKKKSMKKLRERLKAGRDANDFNSGIAAAAPLAVISSGSAIPSTPESKATSPAVGSKEEVHIAELLKTGLNKKSSELWFSAYSMFDTDSSGKLDADGVSKFFNKFGENLADDEIQYVLSQLAGGTDSLGQASSVSLVDFAVFMNESIREPQQGKMAPHQQARFGAAYDLFTQNSALLDSDRAKGAMMALCEEVTMEEAAEMAAMAPSKQRFVQVLESHLLNEVEEGAGVGGKRSSTRAAVSQGGGNGNSVDGVNVAKYKRMLKMHVPRPAVRMKMKTEGVPPHVIDLFLG